MSVRGMIMCAAIALGIGSAHAENFDGTWNVTLVCPKAADGALGYEFKFDAQIKDSVLRGQHGIPGNPGSLTIEGKVAPDGAVTIDAGGHTGAPDYSVGRVKPASLYRYIATGKFEGARGTARRVAPRPCDFTFVRQ